MTVRKFCKCGVKLEREVADEDAAREVTAKFRVAHSGYGHGPANRERYLQALSRIVARRAKANSTRQVKPLLLAIAHAESSMGNDVRLHRWIAGPGIIFCSVCLLLKQASGIHPYCAGAALMKPSEFIGYPLPWLRGI